MVITVSLYNLHVSEVNKFLILIHIWEKIVYVSNRQMSVSLSVI